MKKLLPLIALCVFLSCSATAQDFNSAIQNARTSYSSGDLENARFAMRQMMQDLDLLSGKEILKLLPASLGGLSATTSSDAVNAGIGFAGVVIERSYNSGDQNVKMEIISQSPLLSSINAILALPFMGGNNGNQQVIKIDGYKALLQKEADQPGVYTLQVPLSSALLTVTTKGFTGDMQKLSAEIPVSQITQKLN